MTTTTAPTSGTSGLFQTDNKGRPDSTLERSEEGVPGRSQNPEPDLEKPESGEPETATATESVSDLMRQPYETTFDLKDEDGDQLN